MVSGMISLTTLIRACLTSIMQTVNNVKIARKNDVVIPHLSCTLLCFYSHFEQDGNSETNLRFRLRSTKVSHGSPSVSNIKKFLWEERSLYAGEDVSRLYFFFSLGIFWRLCITEAILCNLCIITYYINILILCTHF